MSENKRRFSRDTTTPIATPLRCVFSVNNEKNTPLKIINYHYKGACFKTDLPADTILNNKGSIIFFIGLHSLGEKLKYRIAWESIEQDGCFGVEFSNAITQKLERPERFASHRFSEPTVIGLDPLDPNRKIYFKVKNLSRTGLLLNTSLSNKHIFPGMELEKATLAIPGSGEVIVDLYIENCRESDDASIDYGASIKSSSKQFLDIAGKYLSTLTSLAKADRIESFANENLLNKNLSDHLTLRIVDNQTDYDKVLKLRFEAYKRAGKVRTSDSYKDMGSGLKSEGFLLAAFLGGQLVASCEFRVGKHHVLNLNKKINIKNIKEINSDNISEVNKLVVHPKAKGTDIILGIFQKIHAIATLHGAPDGLILSEKKLIPLYERLGFKPLNYQIEHPTIEGIDLQLMLIKGEAYSSSKGMNPYAWSVAFELSHHFFNKIGIQPKVKFSTKQQVVKVLTKAYIKRKNKSRSIPQKNTIDSHNKENTQDVSNAKWTKQHINATVMLPYLLESDRLIGKENTDDILFKYSIGREYFDKVSNWISIDFFNCFLEDFSEMGSTSELNKAAAYRATTKEILGANYFLMKHFFSPRLAFKAFEKYFPKFNKTRLYAVVESGINFCRIQITNPYPELIPRDRSTKDHWAALLDAYVKVLTGSPAEVKIIKSTFDGDEYCEYLVKWKNPIIKKAAKAIAIISLIYLPIHLIFDTQQLNQVNLHTVSYLLIICVFALLLYMTRRAKVKYNEILESMMELEKSADNKYRELQKSKSLVEESYQESFLLDSLNRTIQKTDNLNSILHLALENACTRFGFKRGFIMIADNDSNSLRTASVYGASQTITDLWRFKVDISQKRDNPALISSAFHSGQSVIINDIQSHMFHLNEKSKQLIKNLQVDAFTIVPIPSEITNWGVIVASKALNDTPINQKELQSLKRIAQSIGLALDKKSKLEAEISARKVFQKFVPAWLVDETLKDNSPKLGGKSKEAICLFMDIRNFTAISSDLPPEILVELVNTIFHSLQTSVAKHGGVIDKFLGDGALVTWGVFPSSPLNPESVLQSVDSFLDKLSQINKSLIQKGMTPLEVGFGIEKGPVIAGNIGSSERMEFTVIGSTVNIASRLQNLTKKLNCSIVVSQNVLQLSSLDQNWQVHENIKIRGIEETMSIAIRKNTKAAA
jgi:class 3 adenylate cyclase